MQDSGPIQAFVQWDFFSDRRKHIDWTLSEKMYFKGRFLFHIMNLNRPFIPRSLD
jgi:hypothetical protein